MFSSFSATMNFFGKKKHKGLKSELSPDMNVSGAYRISRDDSFGYNNSFASEQMQQQMRQTRSTNDLTNVRHVPLNSRQSATEVSRDPRGGQNTQDPRTTAQNMKIVKQQEKEQKRLEKQLQNEQKAKERKARKEQERQEKLAKKTGKRSTGKEEKTGKKSNKSVAPQPPIAPPVAHSSQQYPTNTLQSSISRSSGPPPYSADPRLEPESTVSDATGNVAFRKPQDNGSWDMISEHRQQIKTTNVSDGNIKNKPLIMDLNYRFEEQGKSNSDA